MNSPYPQASLGEMSVDTDQDIQIAEGTTAAGSPTALSPLPPDASSPGSASGSPVALAEDSDTEPSATSATGTGSGGGARKRKPLKIQQIQV